MLVSHARQRLARLQRPMEEEVPAFSRGPNGIFVVRINTDPDAVLTGRTVVVAEPNSRIVAAVVTTHAVKVKNGMTSNAAAYINTESCPLVKLGHGAEFCVVRIERGIELFSGASGPGIDAHSSTPGKPHR